MLFLLQSTDELIYLEETNYLTDYISLVNSILNLLYTIA